jgi:hypothetical protein
LDLLKGTSYLEIGVNRGVTFHGVRAANKVAVDPEFLFNIEEAKVNNPGCTYCSATSDDYFLKHYTGEVFDVAYLDGLHTFEQTLRDLMNVVGVMNPKGIIVIDDVHPTSYAASLRSLDKFGPLKTLTNDLADMSWMGDVYKLVWFIDSFMPAYTYRCVEENHGQLVMWRKHREVGTAGDRLVSDISVLSYVDMMLNRQVFNIKPFEQIMNDARRDLELDAG